MRPLTTPHHSHDAPSIGLDAEVRDSIRVIHRRRGLKMITMILGLILVLVTAVLFTYLAYTDGPQGVSHAQPPNLQLSS